MNRQTLPINEIQVIDRQRQDLGDIQALADSLRRYGIIQPVVISNEKRLIAGGRRMAAAKSLGWTSIDVVYRETLSEEELYCLELEENLQRKDETWQEQAISIAKIHSLKRMSAALASEPDWGQKETARMLGLKSHANVSYALKVAERLKSSPSDPLWQCENMSQAWDKIMEEQQNLATAELARRQNAATEAHQLEGIEEVWNVPEEILEIDARSEIQPEPETVSSDILLLRQRPYADLSKDEAKVLYLSNPLNPPEKFEEYYAFKQTLIEAKNTINLSKMLVNGDSITFMNDPSNAGRFDHIITDIPYGIDMSMLEQENTGMDVSSTAAEHDVQSNYNLISVFFTAAFKCTKEKAFVITWCDAMMFHWMAELAEEAGFAVQRWPFHWVKPGGMNQAAQYNQTKATEIAIICRKPGATRILNTGLNYECCGKDELCDDLDHPFAKPFVLWERLASEVSIEGQLILEPFMGQGSGVISMLRMKRNVVGVELNEAHYNKALFNVKNLHFLRLNPNLKFI